jgi:hypothetical protein
MEDVAKRLQSPMLDGDLKLGHAFGGAGPGAVVFFGVHTALRVFSGSWRTYPEIRDFFWEVP